MRSNIGRHETSLEIAREAKKIILMSRALVGYAQGIGLTRDAEGYCVSVNLDQELPNSIRSGFPTTVSTSGGEVRVVYRVVGPISTTAPSGNSRFASAAER